ncbi:integrin-linked protein kinase 1-like protein [Tanacetum coccineum]
MTSNALPMLKMTYLSSSLDTCTPAWIFYVLTCSGTIEVCMRRYVAPEVFRNEDYDTKVDVFSFALILQEMIEGNQPFFMKNEDDVPKAYVANERPPFNAPSKSYAHGLKELIEECWHEKPDARPTFREIITRLESTYHSVNRRRRWKVRPLKWFQKVETIWKKEDSIYVFDDHDMALDIMYSV